MGQGVLLKLDEGIVDAIRRWLKSRKKRKRFTRSDVAVSKQWSKHVKETLAKLEELKKRHPEQTDEIERLKREIKSWKKDPSYKTYKDIKNWKKKIASTLKKAGVGLALGIAALGIFSKLREDVFFSEEVLLDELTTDVPSYTIDECIVGLLRGAPVRGYLEEKAIWTITD